MTKAALVPTYATLQISLSKINTGNSVATGNGKTVVIATVRLKLYRFSDYVM